MSKSAKKQKERARAQAAEAAAAAPNAMAADAPRMPASPKAAGATGVDEALFEKVAEAAMLAGEPREEGERQAWVYNGDTLSIKYVEEDDAHPRRLMVAAFRQGVVFQVEGDRQVVNSPGPWVDELPTGDEPPNPA